MVFPEDVSDKPLIEDILRTKKKQVKTFVSPETFQSGPDKDLFLVPDKKIFVLLSCWLGYSADNQSGGGQVEITSNQPGQLVIIGTICKANPGASETFNENITLSFGEGIRFPANTLFQLTQGSSMNVRAGIIGFLVDDTALDLYYL